MAKTEASAPPISREKTEWGVRLKTRPFESQATLAAMEISFDVNLPKPGRSPEIKVWFSAVPVSTPLRVSDINIWVASIRQVEAEARAVSEEMVSGKKKPTKKKS